MLPYIVRKIPIDKNMVDLIISRSIAAGTVNWCSSKSCNIFISWKLKYQSSPQKGGYFEWNMLVPYVVTKGVALFFLSADSPSSIT